MKPKFKVGDIVKFHDKITQEISIQQITKITNNEYYIKDIIFNVEFCYTFFYYEKETDYETSPELLTNEEKLELL